MIQDLENEVWKPIIGYECYYEVSNFGRIKSLKRITSCKNGVTQERNEKLISTHTNHSNPYSVLTLTIGHSKRYYLHRIIANSFILNQEGKPCINHINGIKTDNRVENLEWVTHRENTSHAILIGKVKKGEAHAKAIKVINTSNGMIFGTITAAAQSINISRQKLRLMLRGEKENKTPFIYLHGRKVFN